MPLHAWHRRNVLSLGASGHGPQPPPLPVRKRGEKDQILLPGTVYFLKFIFFVVDNFTVPGERDCLMIVKSGCLLLASTCTVIL